MPLFHSAFSLKMAVTLKEVNDNITTHTVKALFRATILSKRDDKAYDSKIKLVHGIMTHRVY